MNRDFAEMLNALSAENVGFLVVGVYSVAGHGVPPATKASAILMCASCDGAG